MKLRQLLSVFLVLCLVASFFAPSFAFAANKDVVVSTIVYTYGNENATELIEGKVLTSTIELIRFDSKPEENMIYALMLYNDNKIVKADTCVVSVPSGVKKTFKTTLELTNLEDDSYVVATLWNNASEMTPVAYSSLFPKGTADLTSITVGGEPIEGFKAEKTEYNYKIKDDSKDLPYIKATPLDGSSTIDISYPVEFPGSASIKVTTATGISKVYKVNFDASAPTGFVDNLVMKDSINDAPIAWGSAFALVKNDLQVGDMCFSDRSNSNMVFSKVDDSLVGSTYIQGALNWQNGGSLPYSTLWKNPEVCEDFYTFDINQDAIVRIITDSTSKADYLTQNGYEHTVNDEGYLVGFASDTVKFNNMYSKIYRVPKGEKVTVKIPNVSGVTAYTFVQSVWNEPAWEEEIQMPSSQLENLMTDGKVIEGFASSKYEYNVEVPYGADIPFITAVAKDSKATVDIFQATSLPGAAVVTVSAEYAEDSVYTINFTEGVPEFAQLKNLSVDGVAIDGFSRDTYEYTVEVSKAIVDAPVVTWEGLDGEVTATVANPTEFPGKAVVTTERDGSESRTYTINYIVSGNLAGNVKMKETYKDATVDWQGKVAVYKQNLKVGDRCFSDRANDTMSFSKVDADLKGKDWIQGALNWQNGSDAAYCKLWKDATFYDDFYTFEIYRGATINIITQYVNKQTNLTANGYKYTNNPEGYLVGYTSGPVTYPHKYTKHFDVTDGVAIVKIPNLGAGSACYVVIDYDDYGYTPEPEPEDYRNLADIQINGVSVGGFDSETLEYEVKCYNTFNIPEVTAELADADNATVSITQASKIPGSATVSVGCEGFADKVYTINFTMDAPLQNLKMKETYKDATINWDGKVAVYKTNLQVGNRCYSDRFTDTMSFSKVDDSLKGKDWIQGALNWAYGGSNAYCVLWKDTTFYEDFYTFDLYREAKVMIITDSAYRKEALEADGWTHTHSDDAYLIGYTSADFPYCEMFSKTFIPEDGPVTVKIPNMRGVSGYTVLDYNVEQ